MWIDLLLPDGLAGPATSPDQPDADRSPPLTA
jgi:hypothetical protein